MTEVTVKFETGDSGASRRAHFDGVPLKFTNGVAVKKLAAGERAFTWFIHAAGGSKYTITVTVGATTLFSHSATLDSSLMDGGIQWLTA